MKNFIPVFAAVTLCLATWLQLHFIERMNPETAFDERIAVTGSLSESTQTSEVESQSVVDWSPRDQLLLELINRARRDPPAEAKRFGIDLNADLDEGTISNAPKQPLAPNQLLTEAARNHSRDMLAQNYFSHESPDGTQPATRATAAGYEWNYIGENISWGGSTGTLNKNEQVAERHKGLVLSAGHRENLFKEEFREVGLSFEFGKYKHEGVVFNACMLTELFGANLQTDPFITGVVFTDASNGSAVDDGFYSLGEGVNGGQVVAVNLATQVKYTGIINHAGGYSLQVPEGQYQVRVTGSGPEDIEYVAENVSVQDSNVKVDFETTTARKLSEPAK